MCIQDNFAVERQSYTSILRNQPSHSFVDHDAKKSVEIVLFKFGMCECDSYGVKIQIVKWNLLHSFFNEVPYPLIVTEWVGIQDTTVFSL